MTTSESRRKVGDEKKRKKKDKDEKKKKKSSKSSRDLSRAKSERYPQSHKRGREKDSTRSPRRKSVG